jgi:beta-fructofuranosidase
MKKIAIVLVTVFLVTFISFNAKSQDKENSEPVWGSNENVTQTILQNTRSLREKLLDDPYRPAYHFCVPEDDGSPGDPNGAFFKDGIYHLMYLYNRAGSGFSWGHISSKDLIHWRQHSDGIGVGPNDEGVFSGEKH